MNYLQSFIIDNMKSLRTWHIYILIASALIMISSCKKDDIVYELEFEISVPEDWQYWEYYYDDITRYLAYSPERLEDDMALVQDTITESLQIYRLNNSGLDLDEFHAAITTVFEKTTNFQILYESDTAVNGEDARKMIHLQTIRLPVNNSPLDSIDLDIKPMKLLMFKNDYGYIIDCGMLPYTYDYYKPIFDDIVSTFIFKE